MPMRSLLLNENFFRDVCYQMFGKKLQEETTGNGIHKEYRATKNRGSSDESFSLMVFNMKPKL